MELNLPPLVRKTLYVLTLITAPFVAYAQTKGWIGDAEVILFSAQVAVISGLAALNVNQ